MTGQKATLPVRIEQMLALGRSTQYIIDRLGVTVGDVVKAEKRIDAANAEDAEDAA
jgi:hypothetical protein